VFEHIWEWIIVAILSVLFSLTPVLAPPTWAMLAYFQTERDFPLLPVVVIGAVGSTVGRVLLALISRRIGMRIIPQRRRAGLENAIEQIKERKRLSVPLLSLFAFGPVPKSMLFIAAGIARMPLWPGALVYGVARTVIYLVTLTVVETSVTSLDEVFASPIGGPLIIAAQFASVIAVFLMFWLDMPMLLKKMKLLAGRRIVVPTLAFSRKLQNAWSR
jgi:membrane protein YqaA with SNARE-associated domain